MGSLLIGESSQHLFVNFVHSIAQLRDKSATFPGRIDAPNASIPWCFPAFYQTLALKSVDGLTNACSFEFQNSCKLGLSHAFVPQDIGDKAPLSAAQFVAFEC